MSETHSPTSISAQALGSRHLQALQRLRNETLLTFNALQCAPEAEMRESFQALPLLIKGNNSEFPQALRDAKLGLARTTLRRVLQMNSLFFERIFPGFKETALSELAVVPSPSESQSENRPNSNRKGVVESFREKLLEAGASEAPAATLASLVVLEKVFGEELSGAPASGKPRPEELELVLAETDTASNGSGQLQVKPWRQTLRRGEIPNLDSRLLNSIFVTAIVAAHEALQAGEKIHREKKA